MAIMCINPLEFKGNFVHWPLMGGLSHFVQRGGDWAGPQPAHSPLLAVQM